MSKRRKPRDKWSLIKKFKTFLTCSWIENVVTFYGGPYDGCVNYVDQPLTDVYREEILKNRYVLYRLIKLDANTYRAEWFGYETGPIKAPAPSKVTA